MRKGEAADKPVKERPLDMELLERLKSRAPGWLKLEELAGREGVAGEEVESALEALEGFGFQFEHHPYTGIRYVGPAERLCPDQMEWKLATKLVGRRISVWNRVVSTNDLAMRAARSRANEGLVVLAEEQTRGRGRRGRQWFAPPRSSILFSVLLFPSRGCRGARLLTSLGAVATAETIEQATGLEIEIQWPNDVCVGGRKLAGILVEQSAGTVIGIGVNVNASADDFPMHLAHQVTSLAILTGRRWDRSELCRRLIERLDHWYGASNADGPQGVWSRFAELRRLEEGPVESERVRSSTASDGDGR